jgi:hypothetical protein
MRTTRRLLKDISTSNLDIELITNNCKYVDHIKLAERAFDQWKVLVKIAMISLREIVTSVEDDWITNEALIAA